MKRAVGILIGTLGAFCGSTASARCSLPVGWDGVVGKQAHYIVFGELHGSAETPAAIGEIACALAERNTPLLVAVELEDNAGLQRAWSEPQSGFAAAALQAMPEWKTRNDGVTSQAMLDLLVALHTLKDAGRKIHVVAFNDTALAASTRFKDLPGQGPHEAGQAENIRAADAVQAYERVLVLVGNYHARKRPIAPGGVSYEPMAMRLADPSRIVSINVLNSGGQVWNCQIKGNVRAPGPITAAILDCGPHSAGVPEDWVAPPRIVATNGAAGPNSPAGAYDATLLIGTVTASPPAKAPQ
ncbi:hypothetical protein GCM10008023_00730 [Sphingomonas glacialis]|uniref:Haem-binding uptake Tiki superfamily ChaN domain-containing protein n=1 Tax=Sphingomonas glacialis TaxID=658225 RepID=A0ABQ3L706_9SPHN|nr:hypothetical protein [Sphingomonas glacialis]GHH07039.1 hypothetical protein GCM10008023_00730 [Sphingomonas glacialis]